MNVFKKVNGVNVYKAKLQEGKKETTKYFAYNKKKKALVEVFLKEANLVDIDSSADDMDSLGNLKGYSLNGTPMEKVLDAAFDEVPNNYNDAVFILSFNENGKIEAYVAWWTQEEGADDSEPDVYSFVEVSKWNGKEFTYAGDHMHDDEDSKDFEHEIATALGDDIFAFYDAEAFDFKGNMRHGLGDEKVAGAVWYSEHDDSDERYDRMRDDGF